MSGISNIIEIINAKTAEKEKEIIEEAERQKKLKLEEARRKADETASSITKKAELQATSELAKYQASAKLKGKYKMLESKDAIITEVLSATQEKIESIVGKADYKKILTRLIVDASMALKEDKLDLVLPKGHEKYLDIAEIESLVAKERGKKTKFTISKETIRSKGGVKIRTLDGTRWVDNTFESRLVRFENKARDTIASILFGDVDKE
ncbi:MAG: V-type ATP synthase subunit E family protein [Candidatus Thorarchaeota archaeon]|nr:V-type ATP synthase subunit E family protein [Candidatus Thorarchaeota archaeon]